MKTLLGIFLVAATLLASPAGAADSAASPAANSPAVAGEVLESVNVDSYTYLRLKTKDGETWVAVPTTAVKVGAKVTLDNTMVMRNFESKSLKRTFPTIIFGTMGGAATNAGTAMLPSTAAAIDLKSVKVPKAKGANAQTVAEVITKSAQLKDKTVQVRGKIVKYNPGIMGKNWIHLRDGSGTEASSTHDLLVTTTSTAALGDIVTVTGLVHTDKDFGAGYSYKVLIEDASLQR